MMVNTQSTCRMPRQITHSSLPIDMLVEHSRAERAGMSKHNLRFGPPTSQNGSCYYTVKVRIRHNSTDVEGECAVSHHATAPRPPYHLFAISNFTTMPQIIDVLRWNLAIIQLTREGESTYARCLSQTLWRRLAASC